MIVVLVVLLYKNKVSIDYIDKDCFLFIFVFW